MKLKTHVWLIGALAVAASIVALMVQVRHGWAQVSAATQQSARMTTVVGYAELVHELQRERGLSLGTSVGASVGALAPDALLAQQERSRSAARRLGLDDAERESRRDDVAQGRKPPALVFESFSADIDGLLGELSSLTGGSSSEQVHDRLESLSSLARAKEHLGRLRAKSTYLWSLRAPASSLDRTIVGAHALFYEHLRFALESADPATQVKITAVLNADAMTAGLGVVQSIVDTGQWPSTLKPERFSALLSDAIDSLRVAEQALLLEAERDLYSAALDVKRTLTLQVATWGLATLALLWIAVLSGRRVLQGIASLRREARQLILRAAGPGTDGDPVPVDASLGELHDMIDHLSEKARSDPLTGAANRFAFAEHFERERARAQRHGRPLSLVLLDIDLFKRVNDDYGHDSGDSVLRTLVALLETELRAHDVLGRWGGEEFVVLAPEADEGDAAALAEKLRAAICAHAFTGVPIQSASFGVAEWADGEALEALVARADRALYRAKHGGRNCVCLFSDAAEDVESTDVKG